MLNGYCYFNLHLDSLQENILQKFKTRTLPSHNMCHRPLCWVQVSSPQGHSRDISELSWCKQKNMPDFHMKCNSIWIAHTEMSLSGASNFRDPWQTCSVSDKTPAFHSMPGFCSSTALKQEQFNKITYFYTTLLTVILKALCKGGVAAFLSFFISAMVRKGSWPLPHSSQKPKPGHIVVPAQPSFHHPTQRPCYGKVSQPIKTLA